MERKHVHSDEILCNGKEAEQYLWSTIECGISTDVSWNACHRGMDFFRWIAEFGKGGCMGLTHAYRVRMAEVYRVYGKTNKNIFIVVL